MIRPEPKIDTHTIRKEFGIAWAKENPSLAIESVVGFIKEYPGGTICVEDYVYPFGEAVVMTVDVEGKFQG
jgi:hypothetical protein